ncbi:MAG: outer membrane beta-barrel protein [Xanthobacteraceae bacterium]|nr:outer membrane beta-barrel protein [Xanthobacteraceae bacterium]
MKNLSATTAALIALASGSSALAADMPVKAPPAAAIAVYNWTGVYVGGGFGYGMFNLDSSLTNNGVQESIDQTSAGRGWFATVVGGYDHQVNNRIVAGVFADVDFSAIRGHWGDPWWEAAGGINQRWAWAAGGRIGYLFHPAVLSYVNAGYSQARFSRASLFAFGLGTPNGDFIPAQTYSGWFLGGGLEAMLFAGWSVKTEYRLADYGTRSVPIIFNNGVPTAGVTRIHPYVQTARSELIYRFNTGRPVYAAAASAPAMPVYSWTGFYIGAGAGYGMFNLDSSLTVNGTLESANQTWGGRGWFGTVTAGFDSVFSNRMVGGVFADVDISNIKGHFADTWWEASGRITHKWAWAAGARAGYLVLPTVLTYVNGGFTQARFSGVTLFDFGFPTNPTGDSLPAQTYSGWFVGGGVETPLWSGFFVKTEYRYADYRTRTLLVVNDDARIAPDRIHPTVQTVRTDLVYKFNWGAAPVTARY